MWPFLNSMVHKLPKLCQKLRLLAASFGWGRNRLRAATGKCWCEICVSDKLSAAWGHGLGVPWCSFLALPWPRLIKNGWRGVVLRARWMARLAEQGGRSTASASRAWCRLCAGGYSGTATEAQVWLMLRCNCHTVWVRTWPWSIMLAERGRVGSAETPKKGFLGVLT